MIRENDIVGNLLGTTTPTEVVIRISPKIVRKDPLELGEYLTIDYEHEDFKEPVLVRVSEIKLENLSMPVSVLNRPEDFRALSMMGDLSEGEVLTARAVVVGYLDIRNKLNSASIHSSAWRGGAKGDHGAALTSIWSRSGQDWRITV